ncbi:Helicase associated domain protein [Cloacibacillus sp. An23]|uniref:Helicase associated domain protein n=1 Tax=Cloacibacillus sp. An23 TaxID=1965591 RepID=UPI000B3A4FE7|nr:Helicase associated domain protein [Cloacibacillus sp. An23]OUO90132.1 hypothetical protein B5F39_13845 [Cloacibacillus sp. An23]
MIDLFEHNQTTYDKAVSMLAERGKAAVVHPTGTGKSFIAFKLAEDNPSSRVLWLSPSEYIFRTQLENIKSVCGYEPRNIEFRTYAKLMQTNSDGIAKLKPSYIILDEFHRVGAEMWGKGVERLFATYPDVPVLGLSATSIRYLDNRRDMADELFDGNVASEMTLGEAVVRGILTPPEYVLSIYSCSKDIEKYQSRIRRAKTKATRDEAQKKLDALRRSLENAEGLDMVFTKHIKDRHGKYIVFCSNVEHLCEVETHICEWFSGVDNNPVIYKAYSEDAESSKAFDSFRKDDSEHLKLLLCIDMLNEGIHVDGVSGVILLRPTISPIVYKQQIGRALSSGKGHRDNDGNSVPVIIDIVNNIENLYSISAVQEEMNTAINYYRGTGQEDKIINETFTITDETRDSRQLFCELEETLSASWDSMYKLAKAYYEKHHNLDIERRYVTPEGYALGSWLNTQKLVKAGKIHGVLTEERRQKLNAIGIDWQSKYDRAWEKYYNALCKYRYDNGNIDIKANYVTEDGIELGAWISNLRTAKNSRRRGYYLTDERISMLNKLGMIWDKIDFQWEKNYQACVEYYEKHRNLDIPAGYTTAEGLRVGAWIRRIRKARDGRLKGGATLTKEQIARLDAIGMNWQDSYTQRWEYGYGKAKEYYSEHGDLDVPTTYVTEDGFPLGKWLKGHVQAKDKTGRLAIKLTLERKAKLDSLGFKWEQEDSWSKRIAACKEYKTEHGDLNVPQEYVTTDGMWLGKWLYECRRAYRGENSKTVKALTKEQILELESLGMDWRTASDRAWEEKYAAAAEMLEKMKQANSGEKKEEKSKLNAEYPPGHSLRQWLVRQRFLIRHGKLSQQQVSKIEILNKQYGNALRQKHV